MSCADPGHLGESAKAGAILFFPTDLTSFLDLIRQHGDAAYSFMFAYAASHSLLLALFAGYAAHSGALGLGTLIVVCWFGSFTGDAIRQASLRSRNAKSPPAEGHTDALL